MILECPFLFANNSNIFLRKGKLHINIFDTELQGKFEKFEGSACAVSGKAPP
jgi:hypothetical protein